MVLIVDIWSYWSAGEVVLRKCLLKTYMSSVMFHRSAVVTDPWNLRFVFVFCLFFFLFIYFFSRKCFIGQRKKSLRTGSFFREFPRIPLGKLLLCIYLWNLRELRTTVARMLSLTNNTVGNIYALLRHCCGRDLQDRPIVPFGGRVYVVKCDESQFKHKSKVHIGLSGCNVINSYP